MHTPNGDICVLGHSMINDEEPAKSRYFLSVWNIKQRKRVRDINQENVETDFNGKCGSPLRICARRKCNERITVGSEERFDSMD